MPVVFSLRLNDDGSPDWQKRYVRLPPPVDQRPYQLRFVVTGGSLASKNGKLFTNYPLKAHPFVRDRFEGVPFTRESQSDWTCHLTIRKPGVYEYYVEYHDSEGHHQVRSQIRGSFIVEPRLYLPNVSPTSSITNGERIEMLLPLDGISILTVIPKWLPTLQSWPAHFSSFSQTGYNMVHLAPINARGSSNSPYSIYDQLAISDDIFAEKGLSEREKEARMKTIFERVRTENGILCVTDVVWNHTACNSVWLEEHPESGYNLKTAPHLRPAYELDEAIVQFSADVSEVYGLDPHIKTEEELQTVMSLFSSKALPAVKLWEFYVVNVEQALKDLEEALLDPETVVDTERYQVHIGGMSLYDRAQLLRKDGLIDKKDGTRYAKTIDIDVALSFVHRLAQDLDGACHSGGESIESKLKHYEAVLNELNLPYYKTHDDDKTAILANITSRARYLRVDPHGPKLKALSRSDPLNDTYFTRLPRNKVTKGRHDDELMLANNGWIWNADPLLNFAGEDSKAYLRREVIAWGDCVKLRYGNKPADNPWLWSHIEAYTLKMARLFSGFRIDNCHSTPMHVASYFLDVARSANPDLYVFAELFTGSEEKDIMFVGKLGLHSLIREAMNAWDAKEEGRLVYKFGGQPVGSLTFPPEHFPLHMLGHDMGCSTYSALKEGEEVVVDIKGSSPHALFMDCTHDNETPHQRRTAEDTLPNAAVVAMSSCAVGSVKGYDEIVPELLNVVTEKRKYRVPECYEGILPVKAVLNQLHVRMARQGYVEIHVNQEHDFISIHRVHPITHDGFLMIARMAFNKDHGKDVHSPITLRNQRLRVIASAGLQVQVTPIPHDTDSDHDPDVPPQSPTQLYHNLNHFEFPDHPEAAAIRTHRKLLGTISGLPSVLSYATEVTTRATVVEQHLGQDAGGEEGDMQSVVTFDPVNFKPGGILLYRTWVVGSGVDEDARHVRQAAEEDQDLTPTKEEPFKVPRQVDSHGVMAALWDLLGMRDRNAGIEIMVKLGPDVLGAGHLWYGNAEGRWPPGLREAVKKLGLMEINVALYRAGTEEKESIGDGAYDVPGYGPLPYCGFQGFMSALQPVARTNDLGHPVFNNLRAGPWMLDYVSGRLGKYLKYYPSLLALYKWVHTRLQLVVQLSPSFVPKYFTIIVAMVYQALRFRAIELTPGKFITPDAGRPTSPSSTEAFLQACFLTTYQLYGRVGSTGLLSGAYPFGPVGLGPGICTGDGTPRDPCLAAGLPHFATAHMRCWGRDVFIALRGLFIVPGHFEAAKAHIIAFGSTLRHGLIPNLLDQGWSPRYNARDAAWWWLWSVAEYCRAAPEGYAFLGVEVARRFVPRRRYRQGPEYGVGPDTDESDGGDTWSPPDDTKRTYVYKNTIAELCHEILERHARGVTFREYNAGPMLDHAMSSQGFDVTVGTVWDEEGKEGIVYGGNQWNCGTWMDKMGDSEKAGTKGVPATPRDGAAVEIVGMVKAALRFVLAVRKEKKSLWKWDGVVVHVNGKDRLITYEDWNAKLQRSFEKQFFIPADPSEDSQFAIGRVELLNRRGIYKDSVGATKLFMDYQLRPNFCVAMVVAPELFDPKRARAALLVVKDVLASPLGIKTLDPADWGYRGDYDNADDGTDPTTAHGFNYHQGPEWVWVMGFFLRAYIYFFTKAPGHDPAAIPSHISYINRTLLRHKFHILDAVASPYAGLPELTNKDGAFCRDSCPTQAWSGSVMVEVVRDLCEVGV